MAARGRTHDGPISESVHDTLVYLCAEFGACFFARMNAIYAIFQLNRSTIRKLLVLNWFSKIIRSPVVFFSCFSQLMQHVVAPPTLSSDPARLVEEFPKWLEKVSSKIPGGIVLVLDSLDRFQVVTCPQITYFDAFVERFFQPALTKAGVKKKFLWFEWWL